MWYEILPAYFIIVGALAFAAGGSALMNRIALGNFYRRSLHSREERLNYLRDRRLDKYMNPYRWHGLETLGHHEGDDTVVEDADDDEIVAKDVEREECPADLKPQKNIFVEEVEGEDKDVAKEDEK